MTRSSRPSPATVRTMASAFGLASTFIGPRLPGLQADDLVPELLFLRKLLDADVLRLQVLLEAPTPELTAQARLLVPAEGGGRDDHVVGVDPYGSGADALGDLDGAGRIPRPDGPRQAVDRVVRVPDGLFDRLVAHDRQHRAEDLLLRDAHRGLHVAEDRGLVVVAALVALAGQPLAAGEELRPLVLPDLDVAVDGL